MLLFTYPGLLDGPNRSRNAGQIKAGRGAGAPKRRCGLRSGVDVAPAATLSELMYTLSIIIDYEKIVKRDTNTKR